MHERNGAMKFVPGSHKKLLSENEIKTISENGEFAPMEMESGEVVAFHSSVLKTYSHATSQKRVGMIHLEIVKENDTNIV